MRISRMNRVLTLSRLTVVPRGSVCRSQKPEPERVCWFESSLGHHAFITTISTKNKSLSGVCSCYFGTIHSYRFCCSTHIKHRKTPIPWTLGTNLAPNAQASFSIKIKHKFARAAAVLSDWSRILLVPPTVRLLAHLTAGVSNGA